MMLEMMRAMPLRHFRFAATPLRHLPLITPMIIDIRCCCCHVGFDTDTLFRLHACFARFHAMIIFAYAIRCSDVTPYYAAITLSACC